LFAHTPERSEWPSAVRGALYAPAGADASRPAVLLWPATGTRASRNTAVTIANAAGRTKRLVRITTSLASEEYSQQDSDAL
jgi:hypothetical protein